MFAGDLSLGTFLLVNGHHLLKKHKDQELFQHAIRISLITALLGSIAVIYVGDLQAKHLVQSQPMKLAAAEALWNSENPASLSLVSIPDQQHHTNTIEISVPYGLSFLAHDSLHGEVQGINLEGFDFGIGILLPFLGKNDGERRMIYNAIGPFWDGNEVWLITAGGAIFAAFPILYAALFSSFYLEMFAILVALVLRGAAFEFRSRRESPGWRSFWDWMMFVGSLLPSFFWGVIISNLLRGIPINASMNYAGGVWNLLNLQALLYGVLFVLVFTMHGAVFLDLRVTGVLRERTRRVAQRLSFFALLMPGGTGQLRGCLATPGSISAGGRQS